MSCLQTCDAVVLSGEIIYLALLTNGHLFYQLHEFRSNSSILHLYSVNQAPKNAKFPKRPINNIEIMPTTSPPSPSPSSSRRRRSSSNLTLHLLPNKRLPRRPVALGKVLHPGRLHGVEQVRDAVHVLIELVLLELAVVVLDAEGAEDPELFDFAGEGEEFFDGCVLFTSLLSVSFVYFSFESFTERGVEVRGIVGVEGGDVLVRRIPS